MGSLINAPGILVYVAEHDLAAGKGVSTEIASQIKSCDLFVLLWTGDAQRSHYVAKEVFLAKAEAKPIIPIVLERGIPLPAELGDIKHLTIDQDPANQLKWLQAETSDRARNKQTSSFLALCLLGFVAWAMLKGDQ